MSLHLIESRKVVAASSRKRHGVLVSVSVHAVLIVSTFTLATASPVVDIVRDRTDVIYAPPAPSEPPVVKVAQAGSSPSHQAAPPVDNFPLVPTMPIVIPTVIPAIDVGQATETLFSTREVGRHTSAAGDGAGSGSNTTSAGSLAILGEAQVDKTVSILSGYRTPRYPESLRAAGVQQTVNVEFVVDTLGRIEPGSLSFREGAHGSLMISVREALSNAKFRPAEAAGRRVRQRVAQAFVFSLDK